MVHFTCDTLFQRLVLGQETPEENKSLEKQETCAPQLKDLCRLKARRTCLSFHPSSLQKFQRQQILNLNRTRVECAVFSKQRHLCRGFTCKETGRRREGSCNRFFSLFPPLFCSCHSLYLHWMLCNFHPCVSVFSCFKSNHFG